MQPRCPDPERLALLIESRLGRLSRARILRHAADCVSCRRQLAIASLAPMGPIRAALESHLSSGRLTVAAGLLLGVVAVWALRSGDEPEPMPRKVRSSAPLARSSRDPRLPVAVRGRPGASPGSVEPGEAESALPDEAPPPRETGDVEDPAPAPVPAPPSSVDLTPASPPRRLDSVAEAPRPPSSDAPTVESEAMGRLAILDPFGSLALEGVGGRSPVLGSRVVPVEARLTAVGRPSGFRLGDGLHVQLSAGSAVSVYQNLTRRCAGLSVHQGALLVECAQPQSLYLRRDGSAGTLEGMSGPVLVNAGAKADALSLTPVGAVAVVWRRGGLPPLEIAAGETLGVDAAGQEVAAKGGKAKPPLARFAGWPEPTTLFYSTFDEEVQGMERPLLVQGAAREGYVTGVPGAKGRRTIELGLPSSIPTLPADATLRLRVRTTAARIQCGVGWNASRAVPLTVAQRNRSETAWTTLSVAFSAFDPDGHRSGGGGGGRRGFRGNLTLVAEAPSRVSSEDLVFDIDEIEISRP